MVSNSTTSRLTAIEGLRAYLALWVVFSHTLQWSGFSEAGLDGLWAWAWQGVLAVKVFMIISGFVIFHRIEEKKETFGVFILHRFFRIYPLYILLFLVSLPLSLPALWQNLPAAAQIGRLEPTYFDWTGNTGVHVVLHSLMLQGLPPESLVASSPYAFLPPAWSIAVEFQFYLLAPAIYFVATQGSRRAQAAMYAACFLLLVVTNKALFALINPLSLPFFWSYFLVGILSFFCYRKLKGKLGLPLLACVALALFKVSDKSANLLPVCGWLVFFGLLLEGTATPASRFLLPAFTNRLMQYLGRISYSIYLSHWPVMVAIHLGLVRFGFRAGEKSQLLLLSACTLIGTLAVSAVLYHTIEKPGIALGKKIARRIFPVRQFTPGLVNATW